MARELAIRDWIAERSVECPAAPALLDMSGSVRSTFAELDRRVSDLARAFRAFGIGRDTRVAVSLVDGPEALTVLLALMSISAVAPVHPTAAEPSVEALVDKLDISVIVGGSRPASAAWRVAEARGLLYVELETDPARDVAARLVAHRALRTPSRAVAGLDDVALYISSSVTTGNATVVAITQRSLDRNVATHGRLNGYGPRTRAICVMNFTYLFAHVRAALPILRFGGAVALGPGYRFADLKRCCEAFAPTTMAATPTIIQKFIADAERRPWRPRPGVLGRFHATGEAIPHDLRSRLRDVFDASLGTNYGMTEVSPQVAICEPDDGCAPGAAGRIVAPWIVDILGEDGAAVPAGTTGRIALRGGYVNRIVGLERETRFDGEGRFLTGDRGFVDADGVLHIAGRADDVINRGGEKIDPSPIERALESDPDVIRAVAFGTADPQMGQKVCALIVLREGATRGEREIGACAAPRINGWGMPDRLIVVPEIPTTANGKVSRRELGLRYPDA